MGKRSKGGMGRQRIISAEALELRLLLAGGVGVNNVWKYEGNSGTTDYVFTIHRFSPVGSGSVRWRTSDATATAGSDYIPASGKVIFRPHEVEKQVTVKVIGDTEREYSEWFRLDLFKPKGLKISDQFFTGEGNIANDDGDPDAHFDLPGSRFPVVSEGDGKVGFLLKKLGNPDKTISINYTTVERSDENDPHGARAGIDFEKTTGTFTLGPGEMEGIISVPIIDDNVAEPSKTFEFAFGDHPYTPQIYIQLMDDDPPTVSVDVDRYVRLNEAGYPVVRFTPTQPGETSLDATFDYSTENGSASADLDYTAIASTMHMDGGSAPKFIDVAVLTNEEDSPPRDFTLNIANVTNGIVANTSVTAQIRFDREAPTAASVIGAFVDAATLRADITVNDNFRMLASSIWSDRFFLSGPGGYRDNCWFRIDANLVDAPQEQIPCDLEAPGGTWDAADDGSYTLNVSGNQIEDVAGNKLPGGIIGAFQLVGGKVQQSDFATTDVTQYEGTEPGEITFGVVLLKPSDHEVRVDYSTQPITAEAGSDYSDTQGTLIFQPGETIKHVSVPVLGDQKPEYDEKFALVLSNPTGAQMSGPFQAVATLLNDDGDPEAHFLFPQQTTYTVNEQDGSFAFELQKTGNLDAPLSIDCHTQDIQGYVPATAGTDFEPIQQNFVLESGEASKIIHIKLIDDEQSEEPESFKLVCGNEYTITIIDDDKPDVSVTALPFVVIDNFQHPQLAFEVRLSAPTSHSVVFDYLTEDGSAAAGVDYAATSGHVDITSALQTIWVPILGTATKPTPREFTLKLSNIQGAIEETIQTSGSIVFDAELPTARLTQLMLPRRKWEDVRTTITFHDNFRLSVYRGFSEYDVSLSGPKGYLQWCDVGGWPYPPDPDGPQLTLNCSFTSRGGWDWRDNGRYTLHVDGSAYDLGGNHLAAGELGTFVLKLKKPKTPPRQRHHRARPAK
jgi:hypothetical protein